MNNIYAIPLSLATMIGGAITIVEYLRKRTVEIEKKHLEGNSLEVKRPLVIRRKRIVRRR